MKFTSKLFNFSVTVSVIIALGIFFSTSCAFAQNQPSSDEINYNLIKVEQKGDNVITKFELNTETGLYEPVYYRVELKKTEFGDGSVTKYLEWSDTQDRTMSEIPVPTEGKTTITVKYDTSTTSYDTQYKDKTKSISVRNPSGTDTDNTYKLIGGAALNNPDSTVISVENALFENNSTKGTIYENISGHMYEEVFGGAVVNGGTIENLSADFVNNSLIMEVDKYDGYAGSKDANGGALANLNTIGKISGNFIGNYVKAFETRIKYGYPDANGGAIYNKGTISDISADFIDNYVTSNHSASGGAIYNKGTITNISGLFYNNRSAAKNYNYAGAVYNDGTITSINADFIANYASGSEGNDSSSGGAVYNGYNGVIDKLHGNFIGNYASSVTNPSSWFSNPAKGGAIANDGIINELSGVFIGNYASGIDKAYGGALYNYYTDVSIDKINADFIGNYAVSSESDAHGGAIANIETTSTFYNNKINNITGDFIGNYAKADNGTAYGGGIYLGNKGLILGIVNGDFIENHAVSASGSAYGGAIYNGQSAISDISIEGINGDFIGNYTIAADDSYGGAIYNKGYIKSINSNFFSNYVKLGLARGGAIYNKGKIGKINGNFIGNYASSHESSAQGGAIYNRDNIDNLNGNFTNNYVFSQTDEARGGAIYNDDDIDNITGNFTGNYASAQGDEARGGAIYNSDDIDKITGDFTGNYATSHESSARGGAIYNSDGIDKITGNFTGNYASSQKSSASGGAIYNSGNSIDEINSNFTGNYASSSENSARGGAIFNSNILKKINGDFTNNYASSLEGAAQGGAVYNNNDNRYVSGNFENNKAQSKSSFAQGGAIYQDFSGYTKEYIYSVEGQEIEPHEYYLSSDSTMLDIANSSFESNKAVSETGNAKGGAIYATANFEDRGQIEIEYTLDDIANDSYLNGGAVINTIDDAILAMENYVKNEIAEYDYYSDSPFEPDFKIVFKNTSFLNNSASALNGKALGGAIYSENTNIEITADNAGVVVSGNYTEDSQGRVQNAIYFALPEPEVIPFESSGGNSVYEIRAYDTKLSLNAVNKGTITFDDQVNGESTDYTKYSSSIGSDEKIPLNNKKVGYYVELTGDSTGKIILNNDIINAQNITLDGTNLTLGKDEVLNQSHALTVNNGTLSLQNSAAGELSLPSIAINDVISTAIDVDLEQGLSDRINTQNLTGTGSIAIDNINLVTDMKDDYWRVKTALSASGIAFSLDETLKLITSKYKYKVNLDGEELVFIRNGLGGLNGAMVESGNIIYSATADEVVEFWYKDNGNIQVGDSLTINGNGHTIKAGENNKEGIILNNDKTLNINNVRDFSGFETAITNNGTLSVSNTTFSNNTNTALKNNSVLELTNTSFKNNTGEKAGAIYSTQDVVIKAESSKVEFTNNKTFSGDSTAIYLDSPDKTLTLSSTGGGNIVLNDSIDGQNGYKVDIKGDKNSYVNINNKVNNALVSINDVNLSPMYNAFQNSDVTMNSGYLNLVNGIAQTMTANSFNVAGNINMAADVDLANVRMDRLPENTTVSNGAFINVNYLNLISEANRDVTNILFAGSDISQYVRYTGSSPVAYSPLYEYKVDYNASTGNFSFTKDSSKFNNAVLPTPVANQAGAFTTQTQTFNYAFQHADTFMNIPYLERIAIKNNNRYAFSPTGDATDTGNYSPLYTKDELAGFWFKPYSSFESIPLKNGPKVSNINYGTLIGYDSALTPISRGYDRVLTGYVGYNGASQRYAGIDTTQNGGVLGGTVTLYKGNFFNATTLSAGASAGSSSTMYGSEDYAMLLAGVANKTGYNFEFKEGKIILQPSFLISYTFVNTFDYTNAAGLKIESDPLNAIQLAPGIKLIGNTKNGWQPYIGVSMIWNLLDKSKVTANDVRLPEMSIKPYVQYGVGVQKRFKDTFTAYAQAMLTNGGRNGISLSAGFRWAVGRKK